MIRSDFRAEHLSIEVEKKLLEIKTAKKILKKKCEQSKKVDNSKTRIDLP
jgi:hypothetical protein